MATYSAFRCPSRVLRRPVFRSFDRSFYERLAAASGHRQKRVASWWRLGDSLYYFGLIASIPLGLFCLLGLPVFLNVVSAPLEGVGESLWWLAPPITFLGSVALGLLGTLVKEMTYQWVSVESDFGQELLPPGLGEPEWGGLVATGRYRVPADFWRNND